ncbi:MAG TPA: BatD family protein [Chitinophagaceae bacterium]|nr:BatD family protein [Chitinophagaceae bacterium]
MKQTGLAIYYLFFLLWQFPVAAQLSFRTVVPQDAVVTGEPFEVQYVLENSDQAASFTAPAFKGFRFVAGPHVYKGSVIHQGVVQPLTNTVYTLVALKPGRYLIQGAGAIVNGTVIRSNDVFVEVLTKKEALAQNKRHELSANNDSEYFLKPGEDPIEKIRRNLFLKVQVDQQHCYVGQPVVATFKLYSRLESRSDIIKNPGFYGFAVYDMVNLSDKAQGSETVNGKTFDVHTIRQVQLYPLQAGQFVIDPMELSNKVEFSRSEVYKQTEQEIAEGLSGNDVFTNNSNNTEVYENTLKSDPINITVKPLPAGQRADSFNAAVGHFSMVAQLNKSELAKNEEGTLTVTITGSGNFMQLSTPAINWPAGIEAFEPVITDTLNKQAVPFAGSKTFRFGFISSGPGIYQIPAIVFRYFDPSVKQYKQISSAPLPLQVSYKEKETQLPDIVVKPVKEYSQKFLWWVAAGVFVIVMLLLGMLFFKKRFTSPEAAPSLPADRQSAAGPITSSIDDLLTAARIMLPADDQSFYRELHRAAWNYFSKKMNLSGSDMNKQGLENKLAAAGISKTLIRNLLHHLSICEMGIYTGVVPMNLDKQTVYMAVKDCLKQIDSTLT